MTAARSSAAASPITPSSYAATTFRAFRKCRHPFITSSANWSRRCFMRRAQARLVRVRGIVQGVGFRPFVFRLARENALSGWVLNEEEGVEIHVEGSEPCLDAFVRGLTR